METQLLQLLFWFAIFLLIIFVNLGYFFVAKSAWEDRGPFISAGFEKILFTFCFFVMLGGSIWWISLLVNNQLLK